MNDLERPLDRPRIPSPGGGGDHRSFHGSRKARVAYGSIPSPIGRLTAVVTERGLAALAFETDDLEEFLKRMADRLSPDIMRRESAIGEPLSWLEAYFSGSQPPLPRLDRSLLTPFQGEVLRAAASIPPGEVRTYGEVAAHVGNPKAARAVGRALGANPIPVVLPCHRVVAADGGLHGYAGGLHRKRLLLEHERTIAGRHKEGLPGD